MTVTIWPMLGTETKPEADDPIETEPLVRAPRVPVTWDGEEADVVLGEVVITLDSEERL